MDPQLEPFKHTLGEYKTLIVKFAEDAHQESLDKRYLFLQLNVATLSFAYARLHLVID
jgi:hypothetical protein